MLATIYVKFVFLSAIENYDEESTQSRNCTFGNGL